MKDSTDFDPVTKAALDAEGVELHVDAADIATIKRLLSAKPKRKTSFGTARPSIDLQEILERVTARHSKVLGDVAEQGDVPKLMTAEWLIAKSEIESCVHEIGGWIGQWPENGYDEHYSNDGSLVITNQLIENVLEDVATEKKKLNKKEKLDCWEHHRLQRSSLVPAQLKSAKDVYDKLSVDKLS